MPAQPVPTKAQFTDAAVTEGGFKAAIEQLHDYLTGLLGSDGEPTTAAAKIYAADSSAAVNTLIIDLPTAPTAYSDGMHVRTQVAITNTGAVQVNVNGLGLVSVRNPYGRTFANGELRAGAVIDMVYVAALGQFIVFAGAIDMTPPGQPLLYNGGPTPPPGYLEEDGTAIDMTDFELLYDDRGSIYGLGIGTALTFDNSVNTLNSAGHGLVDNKVIELSNAGGALPAELAAKQKYFVVNAAANAFQVSLTKGGAPLAFTDNGSGTNYFNKEFLLADPRGYHPRIWNHGAGVDPDAASRTDRGDGTTGDYIGTKQADEFKSHFHYRRAITEAGYDTIYDGASSANTPADLMFQTLATNASGGNESRGKNFNAMLCVRF